MFVSLGSTFTGESRVYKDRSESGCPLVICLENTLQTELYLSAGGSGIKGNTPEARTHSDFTSAWETLRSKMAALVTVIVSHGERW